MSDEYFDDRGWHVDLDHLFAINIDKVIVQFQLEQDGKKLSAVIREPKHLETTIEGRDLIISACKSYIDVALERKKAAPEHDQ